MLAPCPVGSLNHGSRFMGIPDSTFSQNALAGLAFAQVLCAGAPNHNPRCRIIWSDIERFTGHAIANTILDSWHCSGNVAAMKIELTPEQQDFVSLALKTGRIQRAEDAVQEAMLLWVERERRRTEILAAVDAAEASLARGEGTVITQESMRELAEDVNRRGRERLAAERQAPR